MLRTKKPALKLFSVVLMLSFAFEQIGFAAGDLKPIRFSSETEKVHLSYSIPSSVARIEDSFKAPAGSKTVFLLQDAHTNESGQLNAAAALDVLLKNEKGLRYVFTEAAVGDNSLSVLRRAKPLAERQRLARLYVRKGLLHGVEYLDLTSDHDFTLWGVENPGLYVKSLENYRAVAKNRERFETYLKKIRAAYETLSNRLLSPAMKSLLADSEAFDSGKLTLTDYFEFLSREAAIFGVDMKAFPSLLFLKELKARESAIDFEKANREEAKAVEALPAEAREMLREASVKAGASTFAGGLEDPKEGYFALLEERLTRSSVIASPVGAKQSYPELFKYFNYLKAARKIEAAHILDELNKLQASVFAAAANSPDEKTFIGVSRMIRLYEKLFRMTMVPSEYAEYNLLKPSLDFERLTGFLNKKIMDLGTYYDRALFLEPGYEDMLRSCESFYDMTRERDLNFVKEMTRKMDETGQTKAVLITGGFHTVNLKSLLKDKGISYVSIMPQVLRETNHARYENILLGQLRAQPVAGLRPAAATLDSLKAVTSANPVGFAGVQRDKRIVTDFGGVMRDSILTLPDSSVSSRPQDTGARLAVSRRDFLKILGLGTAIVAYPSIARSQPPKASVAGAPASPVLQGAVDLISLSNNQGKTALPEFQSQAFWFDFGKEEEGKATLDLTAGQVIEVEYTLTEGQTLRVNLRPDGQDSGSGADMQIFKDARGERRRIQIRVLNTGKYWQIAFQFGRKAYGRNLKGNTMDTQLIIHSLTLRPAGARMALQDAGSSPAQIEAPRGARMAEEKLKALSYSDVASSISAEAAEKLIADDVVPSVVKEKPGHSADDLPVGRLSGVPTLLITGGAGFMGSNAVRYFLKTHPTYHFIILDDFSIGPKESLIDILGGPDASRVHAFKGDIMDKDLVELLVERADAVVHFAAESNVELSHVNYEKYKRTNIEGTRVVAKAVLKQNERRGRTQHSPIRFIHISTSKVYGDKGESYFSEEAPLNPTNRYTETKASAEKVIMEMNEKESLGATIIRMPTTYGPFKFPTTLMPTTVLHHRLGMPAPIFGAPDKKRDWLSVWDFSRALDLILHKAEPGGVFNIAGNQEKSVQDVVLALLSQIGEKRITLQQAKDQKQVIFLKDNRPDNAAHDTTTDDFLFRETFGFGNVVGFDEGVHDLQDWYLAHPEWIDSIIVSSPERFWGYYNQLYRDHPEMLDDMRRRLSGTASKEEIPAGKIEEAGPRTVQPDGGAMRRASFDEFITLMTEAANQISSGKESVLLGTNIKEISLGMGDIYEKASSAMVARYRGNIENFLSKERPSERKHDFPGALGIFGKLEPRLGSLGHVIFVMVTDGGFKTRLGVKTLAYGYNGIMTLPNSKSFREFQIPVLVSIRNLLKPSLRNKMIPWGAGDNFTVPAGLNIVGKTFSEIPDDAAFVGSGAKTTLLSLRQIETIKQLAGENASVGDIRNAIRTALIESSFHTVMSTIIDERLNNLGMMAADSKTGELSWFGEKVSDNVELVYQAYRNGGVLYKNAFLPLINTEVMFEIYEKLHAIAAKTEGVTWLDEFPVSFFQSVFQSRFETNESWAQKKPKKTNKDPEIDIHDWMNIKSVVDEALRGRKIYIYNFGNDFLWKDAGDLLQMKQLYGLIVSHDKEERRMARAAMGIPQHATYNHNKVAETVGKIEVHPNAYVDAWIIGTGDVVVDEGAVVVDSIIEAAEGTTVHITANAQIIESDLRGVTLRVHDPEKKGYVIDRYFRKDPMIEETLTINGDEHIVSIKLDGAVYHPRNIISLPFKGEIIEQILGNDDHLRLYYPALLDIPNLEGRWAELVRLHPEYLSQFKFAQVKGMEFIKLNDQHLGGVDFDTAQGAVDYWWTANLAADVKRFSPAGARMALSGVSMADSSRFPDAGARMAFPQEIVFPDLNGKLVRRPSPERTALTAEYDLMTAENKKVDAIAPGRPNVQVEVGDGDNTMIIRTLDLGSDESKEYGRPIMEWIRDFAVEQGLEAVKSNTHNPKILHLHLSVFGPENTEVMDDEGGWSRASILYNLGPFRVARFNSPDQEEFDTETGKYDNKVGGWVHLAGGNVLNKSGLEGLLSKGEIEKPGLADRLSLSSHGQLFHNDKPIGEIKYFQRLLTLRSTLSSDSSPKRPQDASAPFTQSSESVHDYRQQLIYRIAEIRGVDTDKVTIESNIEESEYYAKLSHALVIKINGDIVENFDFNIFSPPDKTKYIQTYSFLSGPTQRLALAFVALAHGGVNRLLVSGTEGASDTRKAIDLLVKDGFATIEPVKTKKYRTYYHTYDTHNTTVNLELSKLNELLNGNFKTGARMAVKTETKNKEQIPSSKTSGKGYVAISLPDEYNISSPYEKIRVSKREVMSPKNTSTVKKYLVDRRANDSGFPKDFANKVAKSLGKTLATPFVDLENNKTGIGVNFDDLSRIEYRILKKGSIHILVRSTKVGELENMIRAAREALVNMAAAGGRLALTIEEVRRGDPVYKNLNFSDFRSKIMFGQEGKTAQVYRQDPLLNQDVFFDITFGEVRDNELKLKIVDYEGKSYEVTVNKENGAVIGDVNGPRVGLLWLTPMPDEKGRLTFGRLKLKIPKVFAFNFNPDRIFSGVLNRIGSLKILEVLYEAVRKETLAEGVGFLRSVMKGEPNVREPFVSELTKLLKDFNDEELEILLLEATETKIKKRARTLLDDLADTDQQTASEPTTPANANGARLGQIGKNHPPIGTVQKNLGAQISKAIIQATDGFLNLYQDAITVFALHLADIHSEADLKKPIALSLDNNQPSFFKVVKESVEKGVVQVNLQVLTAEGKYQTIKTIPNAKEALARIKQLSPVEYRKAYVQGVHILLATAAGQTDLAIDTTNVRASLEHALPTGSLAVIENKKVFEAQALILVEGLLRIRQLPEFKKDTFYLTGKFNITQKPFLEDLIEKNKLGSWVRFGEPQRKSAVVRYRDTARMTLAPTPNTAEIQFPVTGFEKDQVLGWYSAIREAGSVGGVYAAHFKGGRILFDEVKADSLPEQTFLFHNSHAVEHLSDRLQWKNVLEGRVTLDAFKNASFYMPLEKIAVDLFVQGARMALQSIGGSV